MINIKKLDGKHLFINHEHIRFMESIPETKITFFDGSTLLIIDSPEEVANKIIQFNSRIQNGAQRAMVPSQFSKPPKTSWPLKGN